MHLLLLTVLLILHSHVKVPCTSQPYCLCSFSSTSCVFTLGISGYNVVHNIGRLNRPSQMKLPLCYFRATLQHPHLESIHSISCQFIPFKWVSDWPNSRYSSTQGTKNASKVVLMVSAVSCSRDVHLRNPVRFVRFVVKTSALEIRHGGQTIQSCGTSRNAHRQRRAIWCSTHHHDLISWDVFASHIAA